MSRADKALELREKGFNCCQCTVCAFAEELDADYKTVFKCAEALGAGMGGMEGLCGAVSGAAMVIGLKNSTANLENPNSKASSCQMSKELLAEFVKKNGSAVCKDLKGTETGKALRSCPDCIRDAVELTDKILNI